MSAASERSMRCCVTACLWLWFPYTRLLVCQCNAALCGDEGTHQDNHTGTRRRSAYMTRTLTQQPSPAPAAMRLHSRAVLLQPTASTASGYTSPRVLGAIKSAALTSAAVRILTDCCSNRRLDASMVCSSKLKATPVPPCGMASAQPSWGGLGRLGVLTASYW